MPNHLCNVDRKIRLARFSCGTVFFLNGFGLANWATRIPDIQRQHGLSQAQLGFALLFIALGSLIGIPVTGRLVARYGSQLVVLWLGLLFGIALLLLPFSTTFLGLLGALLLFGVSNGGLDVAMNAQAVTVERAYKLRVLSNFHALWSVGGLLGASIASFLAGHGMPYSQHLLGIGMSLSIGFLTVPWLMVTGDAEGAKRRTSRLRLTKPLILLGVVAFCSLLAEGAVADGSTVYLRDTLNTGPGFAAFGYAAFQCSMAAIRFFGDGFRARFGEANAVLLSGAVLALGLGSTLVIGQPIAAIIGFACVGAGTAPVFPVAISAAGQVQGASRGSAIAWVTTLGYTGYLAGPPIIGLLAQSSTLRVALCVVVLAGFLIAALSSAAGTARNRGEVG
jgi:MFS family permease